MTRILVAEPDGLPADVLEGLQSFGSVRCEDVPVGELAARIGDANVLWTRLRHRVDAEVLAAASALRVVATPTTGLTHLDLRALEERNIGVVCLKGDLEFLQSIRATTEHTLALILGLLRQLPAAVSHVVEGHWNRDMFRGRELAGATVVVLGYGRIGRQVAALVQAFRAHVIVVDIDAAAQADARDAGFTVLPLIDAVAQADILSIHLDVRDSTRGLVNTGVLSAMPRGAFLVNTARGEVVDEAALMAALDSGQLGGVAVDVLTNEEAAGMGSHALVRCAVQHPRVLVTPHIGGNTLESRDRAERRLATHLARHLATLALQA